MRNIHRRILVVGAARLTLNSYLDKSHDGGINNCAICAIARMRKIEANGDKDECTHCIMSKFGRCTGCITRKCKPWYAHKSNKRLPTVIKFWEKIIELLESKPVSDFVEEWWNEEWWKDSVTDIDTATYVEFEEVDEE